FGSVSRFSFTKIIYWTSPRTGRLIRSGARGSGDRQIRKCDSGCAILGELKGKRIAIQSRSRLRQVEKHCARCPYGFMQCLLPTESGEASASEQWPSDASVGSGRRAAPARSTPDRRGRSQLRAHVEKPGKPKTSRLECIEEGERSPEPTRPGLVNDRCASPV